MNLNSNLEDSCCSWSVDLQYRKTLLERKGSCLGLGLRLNFNYELTALTLHNDEIAQKTQDHWIRSWSVTEPGMVKRS